MEDYCKIHMVSAKPIMTLMTLKKVLEKLLDTKFKRILRSYIVSLSKKISIVNRKVKLTTTELPLSSSYLPAISEWANHGATKHT